VLQYTAEYRSKYDHLTEGAGFLNARGAVQLAQALAAGTTAAIADPTPWSRHIIWGNRRVGGTINPLAGAWRTDVMWGSTATREGSNIVWTVPVRDEDDVVWGTACADLACAADVWGGAPDPSLAWGSIIQLSSDEVAWRRGATDR